MALPRMIRPIVRPISLPIARSPGGGVIGGLLPVWPPPSTRFPILKLPGVGGRLLPIATPIKARTTT